MFVCLLNEWKAHVDMIETFPFLFRINERVDI